MYAYLHMRIKPLNLLQKVPKHFSFIKQGDSYAVVKTTVIIC